MYDMRATPPPTPHPVRDETKVMEEYCWVITDGRADKPRPICFQYRGCLDFNWTPFYIHSISLTTCILITDSPNIRLASDLPARNYCASQGMSVIFIKVTALCQMPNIYITNYFNEIPSPPPPPSLSLFHTHTHKASWYKSQKHFMASWMRSKYFIAPRQFANPAANSTRKWAGHSEATDYATSEE